MHYEVTIKAEIIKTYTVQATDEEDAIDKASQVFYPEATDYSDVYNEEVIDVEETGV